jgi:transposase
MTKTHSTEHCVLVAIDVAKRYNDVLIHWPSGKNRFFKVANTREDHLALTNFLTKQQATVIAALEATADFHHTLAYALAEAGIQVHLASSLACARVRD